ncbi:MAG: hypothetical protein HKP14_07385 [Bacteroidia bacterium]|nr:hypothetical protein [Bacteroidia bacterium]
MKPTIKEKLVYRFERFLNKGGSSIFKSLLVVFLSAFIFIITLRYLLLLLFPELDYLGNFGDHIWKTFLQMTAPGNMNQDNNAPGWLKLTTVLAGFTGVIILSMLIAFITSSLNTFLYNFRKGRGSVIEDDHTVILGWNDRVVDIIRELIIANESEKRGCIVILANHSKEKMDDLIAKRLPDTQTTSVITTSGNPSNISELNRINITSCKSVIILAKCSENATFNEKIESDVQGIKSIMAIKSCQNDSNNIPIIAEIFSEEKRNIISYFNDENLIAIDTWNIMGKLLMQTSLTSGLQLVYNEILSFDGCEVYFYEANWGDVDFFELAYHFEDGIPLGIYNNEEGLILRPSRERKMKKGDEVLILAEDDSTIAYKANALYKPKEIPLRNKKLEQSKKSTLILGWHSVGEIFVHEANDYLLDGSRFDIMYHEPTVELKNTFNHLKSEYSNFEINIINQNPLSKEGLEAIDPSHFENIIILSQNSDISSPDKIDSDTLIILLLLREMSKESSNPKIITQVLNSENQQLINQTDVDDFIISNKLITMVLAQLSEEPRIKILYDDIFSEDGSEIYVKPANLYFDSFPQKITFGDAMGIANKRNEVCLGIRKADKLKDIQNNFGVTLNLPKDKVIELLEDDYLVVLSEDEL